MNITKLELCNRVSQRLKDKQANELKPIFETFLSEIFEVLAEGKRIEIRGFGAFITKTRRKRIGRNPRTGDPVNIPSYTAPVFKFSKEGQKIFDEKLKKVKKTVRKESPPTEDVTPPKIPFKETFSRVVSGRASESFAPR